MKIGRLIALVVVALIAVQQSDALAEHASLVEHIGPTVRSYLEMHGLASALRAHIDENRSPPRSLPGWIDSQFPAHGARKASMDLFGMPYRIDRIQRGYELRSCGPDQRCNTEDDLLMKIVGG